MKPEIESEQKTMESNLPVFIRTPNGRIVSIQAERVEEFRTMLRELRAGTSTLPQETQERLRKLLLE